MVPTAYKALTFYNVKDSSPHSHALPYHLTDPLQVGLTIFPCPQPYCCPRQPALISKSIRNGLIGNKPPYSDGPSLHTSPRTILLATTTNDPRQPEPYNP